MPRIPTEQVTPTRFFVTANLTLTRPDNQALLRTVKLLEHQTEQPSIQATGFVARTKRNEILTHLLFTPADPVKVQRLFEEGKIRGPYFKESTNPKDREGIESVNRQVLEGKHWQSERIGKVDLRIYQPITKRTLLGQIDLTFDAAEEIDSLLKKDLDWIEAYRTIIDKINESRQISLSVVF